MEASAIRSRDSTLSATSCSRLTTMSIGVFFSKKSRPLSPPYALDLDSILVYISRVAVEVGGHRLPYTEMRLFAA